MIKKSNRTENEIQDFSNYFHDRFKTYASKTKRTSAADRLKHMVELEQLEERI